MFTTIPYAAETRSDVREQFEKELKQVLGEEQILYREPMKRHTTFRVGGEAEYFLMPSTEEEIRSVCQLLHRHEMPFLIVGNGSNLLVGDNGISGAVLHLGSLFSKIWMEGTKIHAQSGAFLSVIAKRAAREGLTGLEFSAGIPGSLGGAIAMNAGAYGGEMKQVVESVCVLLQDGTIRRFTNEEMNFRYRHSMVSEQQCLVLSATFALKRGNQEEIFMQMETLAKQRREKQPLEYGSAGSTFKRPEGYFAGKLIMDAGLAGFRIGGAQVSEKHCGFVINTGGATAKDVAAVIRHVQEVVMEKYQVKLEPEVKFAGIFQ